MSTVLQHFDSLAADHALGTSVAGSGERLFGRNTNYRVDTDTGSWFVKQIVGPHAAAALERCLAYDRAADANPGLPRSPRCAVTDAALGIVVQPFLTDAVSGTTLMVDQLFTPDIAATVGRGLAALHGADIAGVPVIEDRSTPAPQIELLQGIPVGHVRHLTGGELQAYGLLQRDLELRKALTRLAHDSAAADPTPIHGDLRADQILQDSDVTWIVDWEEFGLGDPARDTGSFLGEWLYRAVLDIPTGRGGGPAMDRSSGAADIVRRGHEKARVLAPIARSFWHSYRAARPVDDNFVSRTGAFAGWHLLDRLLAGAATNAVLPAIHRAAAGVGRAGVLNPAAVHTLLGTESTP